MPRTAKPPRLYLRKRAGREATYVILDQGREHSTGCGVGSERKAEEAFARYLAAKHQPNWGDGDPANIAVADVLTLYAEKKAPKQAAPELVGYHIPPLLAHFGDKSCWEVTEESCLEYLSKRCAGTGYKRPVKVGTARRELVTLQAALNFAYKSRKITKPIFVSLPESPPGKDRWLTRGEAARLIAGALGFKAVKFGDDGQPIKWKRAGRPQYHVARFILIALYTGTRHTAVLQLRWGVNSEGGWFDLENGVLYRRGYGKADTKKRRTPAPINNRLLPHLVRWKKKTIIGPCEYAGSIILREKTGFARARRFAGLGPDVTPHTLKHTCATWLLQAGISTWEVAGDLGTSEAVIRKTYGHHSPGNMPAARAAFHGHIMGNKRIVA
jgi:integrase